MAFSMSSFHQTTSKKPFSDLKSWKWITEYCFPTHRDLNNTLIRYQSPVTSSREAHLRYVMLRIRNMERDRYLMCGCCPVFWNVTFPWLWVRVGRGGPSTQAAARPVFVCVFAAASQRLFSVSPAGYRCFKAVLFLTGLMFGSVVIFMLCYKERVMDTQLSVEASVGIGLGIGTLCGLVTMLVRSVGLFMVGLLLGLLVGVASLVVRDPNSAD